MSRVVKLPGLIVSTDPTAVAKTGPFGNFTNAGRGNERAATLPIDFPDGYRRGSWMARSAMMFFWTSVVPAPMDV
jgi:hypothetical protein